MKIVIESRVAKVVDFMVNNLKVHDLHYVAHAVAQLADFVLKPEYLAMGAESRRPLTSTKPCEEVRAASDRLDAGDPNTSLR
jgi:hypothetical protein